MELARSEALRDRQARPPSAGLPGPGAADRPTGLGGAPPEPARSGLYLQTFGGFCLYREGRPVGPSAWRRQAAKQVLVRLLLADGRPVSKQELLGALWPDACETAAANRLRVCLHALRRVLEPGLAPRLPSAFLAVGRFECVLLPDPGLEWDGRVLMDALAAAAQARDRGAAITALRTALAALRGPWLPDLDVGADLAAAGFRLHSAATTAALRLGQLALETPDAALARSAAEGAIAVDPASEQAYALLLRALGLQGPPVLVRRAYEFACAEIRRHLDAEPGPVLRRVAGEALAAAGARA